MIRKSLLALAASLMTVTALGGTVALAVLHVAAATPAGQVQLA